MATTTTSLTPDNKGSALLDWRQFESVLALSYEQWEDSRDVHMDRLLLSGDVVVLATFMLSAEYELVWCTEIAALLTLTSSQRQAQSTLLGPSDACIRSALDQLKHQGEESMFHRVSSDQLFAAGKFGEEVCDDNELLQQGFFVHELQKMMQHQDDSFILAQRILCYTPVEQILAEMRNVSLNFPRRPVEAAALTGSEYYAEQIIECWRNTKNAPKNALTCANDFLAFLLPMVALSDSLSIYNWMKRKYLKEIHRDVAEGMTRLQEGLVENCCWYDSINILKYLFEVEKVSSHYLAFPLLEAIRGVNPSCVKVLLNAGCNIDGSTVSVGDNPLCCAILLNAGGGGGKVVATRKKQIISLLLQRGASTNFVQAQVQPLTLVMDQYSPDGDLIAQLIEYHADMRKSIGSINRRNAIMLLTAENDWKSLQRVLRHLTVKWGKEELTGFLNSEEDQHGATALHLAVKSRAKQCEALLVEAGADMHVVSKKTGKTPQQCQGESEEAEENFSLF